MGHPEIPSEFDFGIQDHKEWVQQPLDRTIGIEREEKRGKVSSVLGDSRKVRSGAAK